MKMEIRFPGGQAVDALFDGFAVHTDQPVGSGGGGSAPSPFELFLASIGTCAGLYALRFCQQREIETTGLSVALATEKEAGQSRVARIRIEMRLPERFPEKYRDAIVRAVDQCTVKRHILDSPAFEVTVVGAPVLSPVT